MSRSRHTAALVVLGLCLLALLALPTIGGALERGEPNLELYLSDNEVAPGGTEMIEIDIQNDAELTVGTGQEVLTARATSVELEDTGPFESKSGETAVGPIQDGQIVSVPQQIEVPNDIEPGEYDVSVRVRYAYTSMVSDRAGVSQRQTASETHDVTVVVPDEPRFDISDVKTDVEPGASGPATIEVTNTGTEQANVTRATITGGTGVTIDGSTPEAPAEEIIGDLAPNESTTFTVDVALDRSLSGGEKPLDIQFSYRDSSGIERESQSETASLAPASEQSFSIDKLEDTLAVGYDGEITGEITNDGPRAVDDAVLIVEPMSESLFIEDTRYALPELDAGETTTFRYPTDVSGQADEGPRQLRFSVEYTGSGDATLEDGPISERVFVDPQQDEFSLTDDGISVPQDGQTSFELVITNERQQTLSNIDAKLYTDSPLQTSNDEAFVPELAPGESATMTFDVAAAADAPAETHPVELDFEYETERGETTISDVYQHPIDVEAVETDDGGSFIGSAVGVMTALTAVGLGLGFWWRRT
ncbi:uncharacterized protein Nmag_0787 [Natrialba magadii ATCC 43099]|uniref:CARDB domain-containing protein n=1 Tax=Natrialba magadii (strain ATCC 43099 / DSM 3394 / CCM 3739 / CIP 104546 / IAM 13178 / JCM 8861 / NBRC 102185 / NCIMB 2190 / MS3) TaxID=547559 RepID=D3T013_NATMM|nr:hypothetical protein [Natrialba magadii]ADD04371.1 uncharacterized protein Nmag_0787 [Natrialba magadii ATCC 43099]